MISYINKDELKATMGMSIWRELKAMELLRYESLNFNDNHYRIAGDVFSKDCPSAREAFEKEVVWYKLTKKKRSNLEILKDFDKIADELKHGSKSSK